jgi:hypothetical protein
MSERVREKFTSWLSKQQATPHGAKLLTDNVLKAMEEVVSKGVSPRENALIRQIVKKRLQIKIDLAKIPLTPRDITSRDFLYNVHYLVRAKFGRGIFTLPYSTIPYSSLTFSQ